MLQLQVARYLEYEVHLGSDATDGAGETHGVDQLLDVLSIAGEELTESDVAGSIWSGYLIGMTFPVNNSVNSCL